MIKSKCLLAALFAVVPLAAQAVESSYTFDSISVVEQRSSTTTITGILVNDTVPTTVTLLTGTTAFQIERCERLYSVMLTNPGKFRLTVTKDVVTIPPGSPPGGIPETFVGCALAVNPVGP